MEKRSEQVARDRAIIAIRLATLGGVASALGLTWLFSNLAVEYFSGKPIAARIAPPPEVPPLQAPVQSPPAVIVKVVHHPTAWSGPAAAPRPPAQGPGAAPPAPPAPPAPVCHSTPSKPC